MSPRVLRELMQIYTYTHISGHIYEILQIKMVCQIVLTKDPKDLVGSESSGSKSKALMFGSLEQ